MTTDNTTKKSQLMVLGAIIFSFTLASCGKKLGVAGSESPNRPSNSAPDRPALTSEKTGCEDCDKGGAGTEDTKGDLQAFELAENLLENRYLAFGDYSRFEFVFELSKENKISLEPIRVKNSEEIILKIWALDTISFTEIDRDGESAVKITNLKFEIKLTNEVGEAQIEAFSSGKISLTLLSEQRSLVLDVVSFEQSHAHDRDDPRNWIEKKVSKQIQAVQKTFQEQVVGPAKIYVGPLKVVVEKKAKVYAEKAIAKTKEKLDSIETWKSEMKKKIADAYDKAVKKAIVVRDEALNTIEKAKKYASSYVPWPLPSQNKEGSEPNE